MLQDEIDNAQRAVRTDAYQLSVGEIANMYKNGEIIINPDFQRLFRWEIGQKSKLIESILLGIPIPSIFVFERMDSTWELIDGLQRISTIIEFMGELKDQTSSASRPPIALSATKYLSSLKNVVWEKSDQISDLSVEEQKELSASQKLTIKRSRISVEILKRPSDNKTKYDLFQRLNAGGSAANAQEIRNCIIIMVNDNYARFMRDLSIFSGFLAVVSLSDEQIKKQKDMEYVSRFLVHTYIQYDGKLDVEEFIDESIIELATRNETQQARATFNDTFGLLNLAFGSDALRRIQDGGHAGRVGLAAFECIAVGVAKNIAYIQSKPNPVEHLRLKIKEFWDSPEIDNFFSSGLRGTVRIQRTVSFGERWFSV
ncbi:MAG: DUF262 domain-containing protein [Acidithiobacillus sp.]|uniref:DUF262 domain-containing protein n=1 Tax=Acidithiobacillus sp. TaxID=1872118 RepID=UPI003CFC7722